MYTAELKIFSRHDITAVILAGGMGTRLRSVVSDLPKILAPIAGRPFITYLLDQLLTNGFRHLVLCTGYKGEYVEEALGKKYKNLTIEYSQETKPLGTGGALRFAVDRIRTETIMAMNGDSFIDADLTDYLDKYFEKRYKASLILTRVSDTSRFGRVEIDNAYRVARFVEKGEDADPGWINAGVYLFQKKMLESIPPAEPFSLERGFLPILVGKGLYGYRCEGNFIDIGTPETYTLAEDFFTKLPK